MVQDFWRSQGWLYRESPQGRKSSADKEVKMIAGKKEKWVRLVFFKSEDRKIPACTFILFHLTKTSRYSTQLNVLFPNYFDFKNELSLPRSPHDLFFILGYLKGDEKHYPAIIVGHRPCPTPVISQNLKAACSARSIECLGLLLAFYKASNNRDHRNKEKNKTGQAF